MFLVDGYIVQHTGNTDKFNFEVILLDMVEIGLPNMILHTQVMIRHLTKPI